MTIKKPKIQIKTLSGIAQGQSIGGKVFSPGQGMAASESGKFPYRILDGSPVFYSGFS